MVCLFDGVADQMFRLSVKVKILVPIAIVACKCDSCEEINTGWIGL